jgi:hypothetical protein
MSKIIINVNASSLRNSACLKSWYKTIVEGYVELMPSVKIIYGTAFHSYIHTMYQTGSYQQAKDNALKIFRQPKHSSPKDGEWYRDEKHFVWTCFDTWENYAKLDSTFQVLLKPDGTPATEVTFSIPFYEDSIIQVNLCGTIDTIGKIKNGSYAIRDWKTTGFFDPKIYLSNYSSSSQLRFYVLSLKLMHRFFPDSQLGQIGGSNVGAFIDGVFLKEKQHDLAVKRSDPFNFSNQLDGFEKALTRRIVQLSNAIEDETVQLKEGIVMNTCDRKYFKCAFLPVCLCGNEGIEQMLLQRNFKQETYDPLHRDVI